MTASATLEPMTMASEEGLCGEKRRGCLIKAGAARGD